MLCALFDSTTRLYRLLNTWRAPSRPNFALDPPFSTSTGIMHSLFTSLHVRFLAS